MKRKIGRIVAWAVTLGLLGYLFSTVPAADVAAALKNAAWWTAPAVTLLVLVVYLADSLAIWRTFGWFLTLLSFKEVLVVRGATYLLALVNYALGQGAIVYFVNRARGVPVLRGAAAVLLVMGTNVLLLLVLASIGLGVSSQVPAALRTAVLVGYAGLVVYAILVATKPRWLTSRPIFDVLLAAGVRGHLKALFIRIPHLVSLIGLSYAALRAFGIAVPLGTAILFLPVVYFVAVLPISVQGWGPTQGAMVFFFSPFAAGDNPRATVFACSVTTQALALLVQAVIGIICLRHRVARGLTETPKAA